MKLSECFLSDVHKHNYVPSTWLAKLINLWLTDRYSMCVYLRLTEYFYAKYKYKNFKLYLFLARYFRRKNQVVNQFEHGFEHSIELGTLFHHPGVTLNDNVEIAANVQVFKNVTFALVDGKNCKIGEGSIVFSHVIILGKVIGKNCVVGAGSVVINDIPDNSIVVGNPARIIKTCERAHDYLEFQ